MLGADGGKGTAFGRVVYSQGLAPVPGTKVGAHYFISPIAFVRQLIFYSSFTDKTEPYIYEAT